ncbi:MAG: hypothetical protein P8J45_14505 [Phycisphaerales bacterium]|nr:hypothetical protein [Phycisphaerales bacterium]
MRKITTTVITSAACVITSASSSVLAQDCPEPPFQPVPEGDAYVQTYADSVPRAAELYLTPPDEIPFDRLRVMDPDNAGPIEFTGWVRHPDTNQLEQVPVTIENPVLVVTLLGINYQQTCIEGNFTLQRYRPLERYTCVCDLNGGNIWFTIDGNMRSYLADKVDLRCLNPAIDIEQSQIPCEQAIAWAVPSVGMPYGFGSLEPTPYADLGGGAWWQQQVLVAVGERDAFVRPSFNPTVGPGTKSMPTDNGVPIWDDQLHPPSYRLAEKGDPTFEAQQAILEDFIGYIYTDAPQPPNCGEGIGGCEGTQALIGPEGFKTWLHQWQENSWGTGEPDPSPFSLFPFSSIGLTGDWQNWGVSNEVPSRSLPALSEFILKGQQDVWILGNWPVAQYLAELEPEQTPWCDSCTGDLNLDGQVDELDLQILLSLWGTPNTCANLDKNDAYIGGGTLSRLLAKWGPCPEWPLPQIRPAGCD